MSAPENILYTKEHEWIRFEGDTAVVGITDYALEQLGDVVFLELPEIGKTFKGGDSFGTVESTKTVSDLYCPVTGKVISANTPLCEDLESLTKDPYGQGWLIKLSGAQKSADLLSRDQYQAYIAEQD